MKKNAMVIIEEFVKQTEKGICVKVQGIQTWLPKSQILSWDDEAGVLELPNWLLREKGLEDDTQNAKIAIKRGAARLFAESGYAEEAELDREISRMFAAE